MRYKYRLVYICNPKISSYLIDVEKLERCQSGRSGLPAKELCLYGYRGFESLPLRKIKSFTFNCDCKSFLFLQSNFFGV